MATAVPPLISWYSCTGGRDWRPVSGKQQTTRQVEGVLLAGSSCVRMVFLYRSIRGVSKPGGLDATTRASRSDVIRVIDSGVPVPARSLCGEEWMWRRDYPRLPAVRRSLTENGIEPHPQTPYPTSSRLALDVVCIHLDTMWQLPGGSSTKGLRDSMSDGSSVR
jgi:hypothetical protein